MRILLIDQYSELGGAQRCLLEAAEGFAARGWEVHAAVPGERRVNNPPQVGNLPHNLAPHCSGLYRIACGPFASTRKTLSDVARFAGQLPGQIAAIQRIVRRSRIDLLYVNGPRVLPAAVLARVSRPLVYHAHWDAKQPSAAALTRWAVRFGGVSIVGSSKSVVRPLQGLVPEDRIRVVYNGVAGSANQPRTRQVIRHIAVLGRIAPEKGQLEFVRAARAAAACDRELRFSVCGAPMFADDAYYAAVRAEAAGLPVEFPGWTNDVSDWLATVDLLVAPSDPSDNIPRVILEAFAAGVPVLAFSSGGIPELIQQGVTGLLVEDRSPEGLARAMIEAASQPREMQAIAARARERWQACYTLDRFQSELCEALEDALRRHHQRTPLASAGTNAEA